MYTNWNQVSKNYRSYIKDYGIEIMKNNNLTFSKTFCTCISLCLLSGNVFSQNLKVNAYSFSEGLVRVKIGGLFGYVNKEGIACVVVGNKCGYINAKGKYIIDPEFHAFIMP